MRSLQRREQPHPKLGPFIERLEVLLEANASEARKDRLTLTRITDLLSREGYDGGYDACPPSAPMRQIEGSV